MNLESVRLRLSTPTGSVELTLADGLDADAEERAALNEMRWIKSLRLAGDGTRSLRDAVTHRHDSMWWFIEIYLHKRARIRHLFRAAVAVEAILARHRPSSLAWVEGDSWAGPVVRRVAQRAGVTVSGVPEPPIGRERARTWWQYLQWTALAVLGRLKPRRPVRRAAGSTEAGKLRIVGYVHTAFWRGGGADDEGEGTESYLGPVIDALEAIDDVGAVPLVGLGPRANFRARRWWHAVAEVVDQSSALPVTPVETFAPMRALWPSLAFGVRCLAHSRWLCAGHLRAATAIDGLDLWPIVCEELRGAALLQLPWSARAMDEAGASLDALRPSVVFTYAEAGGWGRALALEARRRAIPCVGLQHGFIYRHWLNYLHEPDEMAPSPGNPADRGFPRPTVTLVYDEYAAHHLRTAGSFPPESVLVTGSPSLDRIVDGVGRVNPETRRRCRARLGAADEQLVLVVSKYTQIGGELPRLLDAAGSLANVRVVLVPHPAETPEPYHRASSGRSHVTVAPSELSLPALLAVARLVVTVHSTVGIDALCVGVPCLVVGLPTNLSPFVEASVMAGTRVGEITPATLRQLLDEGAYRDRLMATAAEFLRRHAIVADGHAAERAAYRLAEIAAQGEVASRVPRQGAARRT